MYLDLITDLKKLKTPLNRPDIHPIENRWSIFSEIFKYFNVEIIKDLKDALQSESSSNHL